MHISGLVLFWGDLVMSFGQETIPPREGGQTGHRESTGAHIWHELGTGGFFELSFTLEEELFFNVLKAELIIELLKRRLPITRQVKTRLFYDLEWLQDLLPVQFSIQFVADVASFQKYWSHAVENTGHVLKRCFLSQQEFRWLLLM